MSMDAVSHSFFISLTDSALGTGIVTLYNLYMRYTKDSYVCMCVYTLTAVPSILTSMRRSVSFWAE